MKRMFILLSLAFTVGLVSPAEARVHINKTYSYVVEITTDHGRFYMTLYQGSPLIGENFIRNVERGYYDGVMIHHFVPGYALQWGDRRTMGQNNAEYPLKHVKNTAYRSIERLDVAMANLESGYPSDKQLVLFLRDLPEQRGEYAVVGRIVKGQEVIPRLSKADRIRQMRVLQYPSYTGEKSYFAGDE